MEDIITNNIDLEFKETPLEHHCHPPRSCLNKRSKYRTFDGSCNNIRPHRSHWGAAGQPMERLLPPAYEDGIWTPRIHAKDGSLLTGAREISRILLGDSDRPHPKYNLLLMQFGQFIAHDVTQSSSVRLGKGILVFKCILFIHKLIPCRNWRVHTMLCSQQPCRLAAGAQTFCLHAHCRGAP